MKQFFIFSLPLFVGLSLFACKSANPNKVRVSSENQFKNKVLGASNNYNRLHQLQTGDYVRYYYKDNNPNTIKKWLVNDGIDSMIYLIRPLGEPAKNGYWTLHYLFNSNLPQNPLLVHLEKITEINRDSFFITRFACPVAITLQDIIEDKYQEKFNWKTLEEEKLFIDFLYNKENNSRFNFFKKLSAYPHSSNKAVTSVSVKGYFSLNTRTETITFHDKDQQAVEVKTNVDKRRYNLDLLSILKNAQLE